MSRESIARLREITSRIDGDTLQPVLEEEKRLIGFLDMEMESWPRAAKFRNLSVGGEYPAKG